MKKRRIRKILIIIAIVFASIFAIGYIGLKILQHQLEEKITGCKIENKDFLTVIPFEYVNNWIVVNVKVKGSDKGFPFIFDTGAQTVLLDSLLNEIGSSNYQKFTFSEKSNDSITHAFKNEIISLHQLNLGEVILKDIGSISAKNSKWEMLNCISPYGIIGYNALQTFFPQIDYQKKQITITDDVKKLPNYNEIIWLDYTPSSKQETPIIKATINDSIIISLFFDTGNSGGISLNSSNLYKKFHNYDSTKTISFLYKPTIRIRGENSKIKESIILKTDSFKICDFVNENYNLIISNESENEYTGFIGNKYLENYIITLDYKNRRIGFIQNGDNTSNIRTFGVSYVANKNHIVISSIHKNSNAYKKGIRCGDTVCSINGVYISELNKEDFCKIYKNEYSLQNPNDSILKLEIAKGNKTNEFVLKNYDRF